MRLGAGLEITWASSRLDGESCQSFVADDRRLPSSLRGTQSISSGHRCGPDVNDTSLECGSVAASVAVLAGIAAADAACCQELGRRSRSGNHHDAEGLLEQVRPAGKQAANQLRQLIDLKDAAHYGFIEVTTAQLKAFASSSGASC